MSVGFYISLKLQSVMILESEGIWNIEYNNGPSQGDHGEEEQGKHDQDGCMPKQVEGDHVVFHIKV